MELDFSLKITDGHPCEGTSDSYCVIVATTSGGKKIRLEMRSEQVALDATNVMGALIKLGLGVKYEKKLFLAEVERAKREAGVGHSEIAVTAGWHGKDFVWNGRVYGRSSGVSTVCSAALRSKKYRYPIHQDRRLVNFIGKHGPKSDVLALSVMAAFSSPLFGTLSNSERPLIHIHGDSKTGKTALLSALSALVKPPNRRELLPFSFTPRSLEEALADSNDGVLFLDEMSTLSRDEVNKIIGEIIYIVSNGRGKSRSKLSLYPDLSWRTIAFMTGEYSLDTLTARRRGSGQDARLINLQVGSAREGGIFDRAGISDLKLAEKCGELARLASEYNGDEYRMWIGRIAKAGRSEMSERFRRIVEGNISRLVGDDVDNLTRTIASKFAAFLTTGEALVKTGMLAWPEKLPFEVVERAYARDISLKQGMTSRQPLEVVQIARHMLAKLYSDEHFARLGAEGVCVRQVKGKGRLIIPKGVMSSWLGEPDEKVYGAIKSAGNLLLGRDGNNSYAQLLLPDGKRQSAMSIDLEKLITLASLSPQAQFP